MAMAVAACFSATALALPVGPQVVAGTAAITQSGNALTVTNSAGAILNWQKFNIGANELVRFNQPVASSTVLNRVLSNDPSVILGNLTSNGKVWLVNPAGILVGPGARIDTAAFVASTLNITNADFLNNRLKFEGAPGAGNVINQGQITTPMGGSVYLIGSNVSNEGIITTPKGETILAAGQTVELIDTATPGIKVQITGAEGNVTNLGQITAAAGRIGIAAPLIKNAGTLNASSVTEEGGRIFLRATKKIELTDTSRVGADGTAGGTVLAITSEDGKISGALTARGEISARGNGNHGSGGFVETSAAKVDIKDISIKTGGGHWLIDPVDVMIQASGTTTVPNATGTVSPTTQLSTVDVATLQTALNNGNHVTIDTQGGTGGNGDITVASEIYVTPTTTTAALTLNAWRNININQNITANGNKLDLNLNSNIGAGGGSSTVQSTVTVNLYSGSLAFTGGSLNLQGTLKNGTLTSSGGTLSPSMSATLDGVTIGSNLSLVGSGQSLLIAGDLILGDSVNFSTGTNYLYFKAAAANIKRATGATAASLTQSGLAYFANHNNNGGTVTIGSGVTLKGYGALGTHVAGGGWINDGSIETTTASTLTITPTNFTNNGMVKATTGGVTITPGNLTLGATSVMQANGNTLTINPTNAWSTATGTIEALSGTVSLGGTLSGVGTLNRTGGSYTVAGTWDLLGGSFSLGSSGATTLSGTLKNGTLTSSGGTLNPTGSGGTSGLIGVLDGITIGSNLSLGTSARDLFIANDLTLGNGVNFSTGANWVWFKAAAANIKLASGATTASLTAGNNSYALYANFSNNAGTVTIANGVTLQGSAALSQNYGGGGWINNGIIETNTASSIIITPANFTNNGTIKATAGAVAISPTNLTLGATSVMQANGNTLTINPTNAWSTATGTIEALSGTVSLGGTLSGVGTLNRTGGSYTVAGIWDLLGGSFSLGSSGTTALTGTLKNGTLTSSGGTLSPSMSATLDGVTIGSNLSLVGSGQSLLIAGDLILGDSVNFSTGTNYLYFKAAAANIKRATGATAASLTQAGYAYYANNNNNSGTVTIGSGVTLKGYGTLGTNFSGGGWINDGSIEATTASTLTITPTNFTNNGMVKATTGGVTITPGNLTLGATSVMQANGNILTISPSNAWNSAGTIQTGAGTITTNNASFINTGTHYCPVKS
jgi:filamentous hemagglutinin family protein